MNHVVVAAWSAVLALLVFMVAGVVIGVVWWISTTAPGLLIPIGIAIGIGIAAGLFDWWTDPARIKVRRGHEED
jgi:hypothetical protein